MRKEAIGIFCLLVIISYSFFPVVAESQDNLDSTGFEEEADRILNATHDLQKLKNQSRLDYLGEKWKSYLLNRTSLSKVDSTLKKANPVFFVVFGQDYDFSYRFFLIILFWIAFFLTFQEIFLYFSTFDKKFSYLFGFILVIISAHSGIVFSVMELFYKGVFGLFGGILLPGYFNHGIFKWLFEIIFLAIIICYLIFSGQLVKLSKKGWDKMRNKERLERVEEQQKAQDILIGDDK